MEQSPDPLKLGLKLDTLLKTAPWAGRPEEHKMPYRRGLDNHKTKHPPEIVRAARLMQAIGLTYNEISRQLHVSWHTVASWLQYKSRTEEETLI